LDVLAISDYNYNVLWYNPHMAGLFYGQMMKTLLLKISNTILAVFQLINKMSDEVANYFIANKDYLFSSVIMNFWQHCLKLENLFCKF